MKPILANIGCYESPNLRAWHPDDPEDIAVHLFVNIGRRGYRGTTEFTIFLATPKGLTHLDPIAPNIIKSEKMIVMKNYDFDSLWQWCERRIEECEAKTWNEALDKLKNLFNWEYQYSES